MTAAALMATIASCDGDDDSPIDAADCSTCAEVQGGDDPANVCPGAPATALSELVGCICSSCATECADTACAMPPAFPSDECQACFGPACSAEITTCMEN
jgi:hypothetical protein